MSNNPEFIYVKCKYCINCDEYYPVAEFGRDSKRKCRLQKICKQCKAKENKAYYAKIKDARKAKLVESKPAVIVEEVVTVPEKPPEHDVVS